MPLIVESLHFYPVKSCGAVDMTELFLGSRGFESGDILDRSWMIVDRHGVLVSQRESPELARIKVGLLADDNGRAKKIVLSTEGKRLLLLDPSTVGDEIATVVIHGKETVAHVASEEASAWFSDFLSQKVRVVHQKAGDIRPCNPKFSVDPAVDTVSFADGFPYLVVNSATLEKLNAGIDRPVSMNRFRPNIVVGNAPPDAEYGWRGVRIGEASLEFVKPCTRCVMTTIDQEDGVKMGPQPLAALVQNYFLSQEINGETVKGTVFGENAIPSTMGVISVGDTIEIIQEKPTYHFRRMAAKRQPS